MEKIDDILFRKAIITQINTQLLKEAEKQGYTPLYSYLWSDNYYALWNINSWDKSEPRPISKKRHTMGNYNESKKVYMNSFVTLSSAIKQGYLN